jgi:hypothetical protein
MKTKSLVAATTVCTLVLSTAGFADETSPACQFAFGKATMELVVDSSDL